LFKELQQKHIIFKNSRTPTKKNYVADSNEKNRYKHSKKKKKKKTNAKVA